MRTDWRDTVSGAADLALVGIAVTVVALPVVTVGAAARTGSFAVARFIADGGLPPARDLARVFRRSLLPGLAAGAAVTAVAALLVIDIAALRDGRVPGGAAVVAATVVLATALVAVAGLALVRLGLDSGDTWRGALGWAGRMAAHRPAAALGVVGVVAGAVVLAVLVPVTAPLVVGYAIFALHVVVGRLVRDDGPPRTRTG